MSDSRDSGLSQAEAYTQRDNASFDAAMTMRTAANEAAFFLPHLRPYMRLLDVGCGPGAITIGFGELVTEVVGLDVRPEALAQAARANQGRSDNVRFQLGSVYQLPFPDDTFDAAFAHIILMHLADPFAALREVHRVLRPGGVIGVRDPDLGSVVTFPPSALRDQYVELRDRVMRHNGGDPFRGRMLRHLLLEAGFLQVEAGASALSAGRLDETRLHTEFLKAQLAGIAQTGLAEGWTDQGFVDSVIDELEAWAERPDAFTVTVMCYAIGRARGAQPR